MTDLDHVWRHIDGARLTDLLVRAVNHYSPSYAEEPAMEVFEHALRQAGISVLRQPVPGPSRDQWRANLIVEMGPKPAELLWVGHVDTVPMMDEDEQVTRRDGDRLYGLGTADMKSGCAAMVEALTALTATAMPFRRGFAMALVVGEEEYGDGSEALIRRVSAPFTVIGEPTGLVPCLDHYGYYEYRLTAGGEVAHAALPEVGASAIHGMLYWLTRILEDAADLPEERRVAINPREIRGGADLFVVAERCEALVDAHAPPGIGSPEIAKLVEQARKLTELSHPRCVLAAEEMFAADGYADDPANPRIQALRRAYEHMGMEWAPKAFRSHSDGNLFHQHGSLPVICGPGRLEVAHTRGEYVSLAETERAARLYAALIYEACVRE